MSAKSEQDVIESSIAKVKDTLKDNKVAVIASALGYTLSNDNKERNALLAGLIAYVFLSNSDDEEEDDS